MGGSSSQTVGYKYFAGLQVVIGNCIEYMININPDNRGWIFKTQAEIDQLKTGDTSIVVKKPNLFGGDKAEGGWVGIIDIHTGKPETLRQNEYLAEQDSQLISAFPYLSYLVFRGANEPNLEIGWDLSNFGMQSGFQLVSMSGMLKDVLYWPKRVYIKDDGTDQWYSSKAGIKTTIVGVSDEIRPLNVSMNGECYFSNVVYSSTSGSIPFAEVAQSYELKFLGAGELGNGEPVGADPSVNHMISESVGTIIPSTDWNKSGPPNYDGYTVGPVDRRYRYSGTFVFLGGELNITGRLSNNGSSFKLSKIIDGVASSILNWSTSVSGSNTFSDYADSVFLENGLYKIDVDVGGRYLFYGTARPLVDVRANISVFNTDMEAVDINPIHKIREIITDDTAMNKPESMINDANFKAAADRVWEEMLGVSGAFTEKSCKEAIDELLYHIEAGIRVNRQTGLYEIVLFRDDLLDLDNAQLFDKSNIKTFNIEIANIDDVINSVNVNYYDRENIKDSSFSLDEIGSVMSSEVNAQTLDFPYFMNRRNAELVGNWKLKQLSTPARKGSFTTGKYDARKINRYDVVKLTWQNQNMIEVPVRIMKIGLGDGRDNTVTLDWVEVIPYSSINYPSMNVDPSTSVVLPPQPNQSIAFEMPYLEAVQRFGQTQVDNELANNPDLGYLMVATKRPQNNSINALLFTDNGTGYQQASIVDYCPAVHLDQNIGYLDSSFAVKNVSAISQAEAGTLILCDEELMVYQSYDTETKILTVKRAALDTVPKPHLQDAVFYFYDAFSAFDSEQHVLSEVIDAKVLTTTPSGIQELGDATAISVEMDARLIRPYPPANVQINGEYFPAEIETDLIITWVDRNRLQQTGGEMLGWFDAGVTLESGATYQLILTELDENQIELRTQNISLGVLNMYTFATSEMNENTRTIQIILRSTRGGYDSYQAFDHTVELSKFFSAPYNLLGVYVP